MQSILINGGSVTLAFPKADEMPITLRAVYRVPPTREASEQKVWIGRVESHTYRFTLRQW